MHSEQHPLSVPYTSQPLLRTTTGSYFVYARETPGDLWADRRQNAHRTSPCDARQMQHASCMHIACRSSMHYDARIMHAHHAQCRAHYAARMRKKYPLWALFGTPVFDLHAKKYPLWAILAQKKYPLWAVIFYTK